MVAGDVVKESERKRSSRAHCDSPESNAWQQCNPRLPQGNGVQVPVGNPKQSLSAVTSKPATDGHSKTSQVEGVKIGIGWSKNNVFL